MILGYSLNGATCLRLRGYHPLRRRFPAILDFTYGFSLRTSTAALVKQTPQPHTRNPCRVSHVHGLASSDFARHYSRNHFCFLFLWVLRCFTSPRSLQTPYVFRRRYPDFTLSGFPHSDIPGSQVGCHLPGAFRRLQRPSSALDAKASTMCT